MPLFVTSAVLGMYSDTLLTHVHPLEEGPAAFADDLAILFASHDHQFFAQIQDLLARLEQFVTGLASQSRLLKLRRRLMISQQGKPYAPILSTKGTLSLQFPLLNLLNTSVFVCALMAICPMSATIFLPYR